MVHDPFAERLAAPTPTPGGGAAAARAGLHAASLLRMVTGITLAKIKQAPTEAVLKLKASAERAEKLSAVFESLEKADMAAFEAYLEALRLPRSTLAEIEKRRTASQAAAAQATEVPLAMLEAARDVLLAVKELLELSRTIPMKAESDLGGAIELACASFRMAELNVRVNLSSLAPEKAVQMRARWKDLEGQVTTLSPALRDALLRKLGE